MTPVDTHESRYEENLPAYALGALDGRELEELKAHLATDCPRCRELLAGWEGELEMLAESVPPVEPSETTRMRILRIPDDGADVLRPLVTPARAAPRRRRWPLVAALAASLVALVVSLGSLWMQASVSQELAQSRAAEDRLAVELERLRGDLAQTRTELTRTRVDFERLLVSVQSLGAPGGRAFVLAGLDPAPGAGGASFIDPLTGRATFYAYGLPELPEDKTYQLWWIADGQPVSGGVFEVDETGRASVDVAQVPAREVDVWAVTVEPAGGVPQPTGEMVLASQTT